ncbi:MAG: hypothetical protein ACE5OY_04825 [Candidatus Bathyarchaeia archaeon]
MGYLTRAPIELDVIEMRGLRIYEGVIPESIDKLVEDIVEREVVLDPVIVGRDHNTVLDGVQRIRALQRLGIPLVPAQFVDYFSDQVLVKSWYRVVKGDGAREALLRMVEGMPGKRRSDQRARGRVPMIVLEFADTKEEIRPAPSVRENFEVAEGMLDGLRDMGFRVGYETEKDSERKLRRGEIDAVVKVLPPLGKSEAVLAALEGKRLFPAKVNRHLINWRVLNVGVPLSILQRDHRSARGAFMILAERKRFRVLPPNSVVRGRRYEESVVYLGE